MNYQKCCLVDTQPLVQGQTQESSCQLVTVDSQTAGSVVTTSLRLLLSLPQLLIPESELGECVTWRKYDVSLKAVDVSPPTCDLLLTIALCRLHSLHRVPWLRGRASDSRLRGPVLRCYNLGQFFFSLYIAPVHSAV